MDRSKKEIQLQQVHHQQDYKRRQKQKTNFERLLINFLILVGAQK